MPCPLVFRRMPSWRQLLHPRHQFPRPEMSRPSRQRAIPAGSPDAARLRGAARIRTGDRGFAVLCLTTWPRRLDGGNGAKSHNCGYDAEEGGLGRPRTINTRARRSLEPSADGPVLAEPSMCGFAAGRPSSKLRFRALPADYMPLPTAPRKSGKPDSNRRPPPWQGGALPTELFPRVRPRGTKKRPLQGAGT